MDVRFKDDDAPERIQDEDEEIEVETENNGESQNDDEMTIKNVQDLINTQHPFGLRLWKPALYKKHRTIMATSERAVHAQPGMETTFEIYVSPGNVAWAILFGWWMALTYILVSIFALYPIALIGFIGRSFTKLLVTVNHRREITGGNVIFRYLHAFFTHLLKCYKYGNLLVNLSHYIFWPFGKYIERLRGKLEEFDHLPCQKLNRHTSFESSIDEHEPLLGEDSVVDSDLAIDIPQHSNSSDAKPCGFFVKSFRRIHRQGLAGYIFTFLTLIILAPIHLIVGGLCLLMVFAVPMAKLNYVLLKHLVRTPLRLHAHLRVPPPKYGPAPRDSNESESPSNVWRPTSVLFYKPYTHRLSESNFTPVEGQPPNNQLFPEAGEIILCTYHAFGLRYYKYTLDGINIIFIDLISLAIFTLVAAKILVPNGMHIPYVTENIVIFVAALLSTIPLAYFIGMAVSSITAQTGSLALGAVINATFGSIVEIILYALALREGGVMKKIVEGGIIGSFLCGLLVLPGVSMVSSGIKRKEQRFNSKSAGVTSTLLIMSAIGAFSPTLFQGIYGGKELRCEACPVEAKYANGTIFDTSRCTGCRFVETDPAEDKFYQENVKPLVYFCAVVLLLTYFIGLWFTLGTHQKHIYAPEKRRKSSSRRRRRSLIPKSPVLGPSIMVHYTEENMTAGPATGDTADMLALPSPAIGEDHRRDSTETAVPHFPETDSELSSISSLEYAADVGHDAPNWSKTKSTVVLLLSTVTFSLIAEVLIESIQHVLESSADGKTYKFLGLTLFALVPMVTEFYNAIAFAMYGNIQLSLEIGSAYVIQVAMLQLPALVAFSAIYGAAYNPVSDLFVLVFPHWDVYGTLFGVFLLTYVYIEGKSNYFKGAMLLCAYLLLITSFYFVPADI